MNATEEFLAKLPGMLAATLPDRKPKLKLASEAELSLETQRERVAKAQRRLMDEEKASFNRAAEHNRRVLAELRAENNRLRPADIAQATIDFWKEYLMKVEAHERWFRRQLDPDRCGIYEVGQFHRD
jgi:hypothetical protein